MMDFGAPRAARRLGLTPMIDVVFLLLVFFMLAAQFGLDRVLALQPAGGATAYSGPPRLVSITTDGVLLNGVPTPIDALAGGLGVLTESPADTIVLQPGQGVPLQALMDVATRLSAEGFTSLAVVE